MLRTGADRRGHEAEGEGAPPAHSREMSEQDMFRACFPKALSVQRTCTRNAWGAAHQACVSNSGSLKFRSGRPTLGSRICDALSNENIWAWARGGCRCWQHIWWESGFNLVPAASAAELSPNMGELSTVFTRRPPPSPAYQNICSLLPPPQTHQLGGTKTHRDPPRPSIEGNLPPHVAAGFVSLLWGFQNKQHSWLGSVCVFMRCLRDLT